jgi:hypothetical protein
VPEPLLAESLTWNGASKHTHAAVKALDIPEGPVVRRPNNWSLWLLLIPFIATLVPPFYNRIDPTIGGLPFFDWYLLVWVVVTAGILSTVYALRRQRGGPGDNQAGQP